MQKLKNKKIRSFLISCIFLTTFFFGTSVYSAPTTTAQNDPGSIHFITLYDNTDAILIECNGKFGMVDSGEDSDYPNGTDSRYPLRPGIVKGRGQEGKVIAYLHSLGVNEDNFEFYIGTHPHSDHIGSADEIIREFHPKRVYLEPYKDEYITDAAHLWDNLYVYDHMITAAKEINTTLIQYFDVNAPLYPETVQITGSILFDSTTLTEDSDFDFSVSLSWENETTDTPTTVTLSPNTESPYGTITYDQGNRWTYEFTGIPKFDDNKDTFNYTITPSSETYSFTALENSEYDFLGSSEASTESAFASTVDPDYSLQALGGIIDEQLDFTNSGSTDAFSSNSISLIDQVVPNNPLDPTNADHGKDSAPAQSGIYDNLGGSVSTPTFYLGGENGLLIEIRNYGAYQAHGKQIDANYFSLGVKVTSMTTGATAFLAGDINNYLGAETALAKELGHVDLLKLGHHGSYGSNTNSYITTLNPKIAVMTGTFEYVTNTSINGECGTLDTLINMAKRGTALYATAWYSNDVPALTFRLDASLSHDNIPTHKSVTAASPYVAIYYSNGFPTVTNGWKTSLIKGTYYFANSYLPVSSTFYKINNDWYFFSGSGVMQTGWVRYNNTYYFMNSSGKMQTGWITSQGNYYYLDASGAMVTGWLTLNSKKYYLNDQGAMVTGWLQKDGHWYYFDSNGSMCTGWINVNNTWYYLSSNGTMLGAGWHWINNQCYYMYSSGAMASNTWIGSYYVDSSGKWIPGKNPPKPRWVSEGSRWWYRHSDGSYTVSNWEYINGKWYYFDQSGWMVTGWLQRNNTWYYLTSSGAMATGWININNTWYYLTSNGAMATGWIKLNNKWYYLSSSGAMLGKGWHYINNQWYYMYSSGVMASNTWIGRYYVDSSGKWIS